jgi:hypothetical protein
VLLPKPGAGAEGPSTGSTRSGGHHDGHTIPRLVDLWRVSIVKDVMLGDALVQNQKPADELEATTFDLVGDVGRRDTMTAVDVTTACRGYGHVWPEHPGMFTRRWRPPPAPITDQCSHCGLTRTDHPDGTRSYTYPTEYWCQH